MNRTEKILNQMIDELELAIIKAKAQLEYVDDYMSKPESWDAKDFIFGKKYFCPICESAESGTCNVLD